MWAVPAAKARAVQPTPGFKCKEDHGASEEFQISGFDLDSRDSLTESLLYCGLADLESTHACSPSDHAYRRLLHPLCPLLLSSEPRASSRGRA